MLRRFWGLCFGGLITVYSKYSTCFFSVVTFLVSSQSAFIEDSGCQDLCNKTSQSSIHRQRFRRLLLSFSSVPKRSIQLVECGEWAIEEIPKFMKEIFCVLKRTSRAELPRRLISLHRKTSHLGLLFWKSGWCLQIDHRPHFRCPSRRQNHKQSHRCFHS